MKCLLRLRMWSCLCFCPWCKPRLRQQCIVQLTSDQSSNIPYLFHLLSHCNRQRTCWLLSENYVNLQPHFVFHISAVEKHETIPLFQCFATNSLSQRNLLARSIRQQIISLVYASNISIRTRSIQNEA